ncbi:hypothetical protein Dsin_005822 [Dipteronia sinensis]|uniref:Uncharacterized protein n=1 Tax=Dipteronia sinensis TaxID=43782 RepID=A0AAE0AY95_9ROSI|nr:hypothetical protein Dsin_005822 [Dipteronia sinensis]
MHTSKITRNSRAIKFTYFRSAVLAPSLTNYNDNSSNNEYGSKGSKDVQKGSDDSNKEAKAKEGIPKKENSSDEVKCKDVHKESGNVEDSDPSRKEGTRIEECDLSNKYTDNEENSVACLRVPGNG